MELSNETVAELTNAINSLTENLVKLELGLIGAFLVSVLFMWFLIKHYENKTNDRADDFLVHKAEEYDSTNNIEKLMEYCLKFIKRYPNDVNVNFYLGLAHYRKRQWVDARNYFLKTSDLNPNWRNTVEGYIEEIESNLKGLERKTNDKTSH